MSAGAWIMLVIGSVILYGGLAAALYNAVKAGKKKDRSKDFANE